MRTGGIIQIIGTRKAGRRNRRMGKGRRVIALPLDLEEV